MPIKAIIWDIGGVIARTEDPAPRNELAAELGVTSDYLNDLVFAGPEGTRAQLGKISVEALWQYARKELGLTPAECPDLQVRFFGGDRIDYELVGHIRALRPQYITVALSNAWNDLRTLLTNRWKIADAFDEIIVSGEEGIKKPDPRIYEIALTRIGVKPEAAVFVDDFIENIEAARQLGINAIHFQSPSQALGDLEGMLGTR